jgi:hypothetical protein
MLRNNDISYKYSSDYAHKICFLFNISMYIEVTNPQNVNTKFETFVGKVKNILTINETTYLFRPQIVNRNTHGKIKEIRNIQINMNKVRLRKYTRTT